MTDQKVYQQVKRFKNGQMSDANEWCPIATRNSTTDIIQMVEATIYKKS
jgi:hypothetical protein